MNREELIRMAREVKGAARTSATDGSLWLLSESHLERFAALVAAAAVRETSAEYRLGWNDGAMMEREACAKVCDARVMGDNNREDEEAKRCAAAIRARGQE